MIIQAFDIAEVSGKLGFMHEKIQQAKTEIISDGIHIWRSFFRRKQARRKVFMEERASSPSCQPPQGPALTSAHYPFWAAVNSTPAQPSYGYVKIPVWTEDEGFAMPPLVPQYSPSVPG